MAGCRVTDVATKNGAEDAPSTSETTTLLPAVEWAPVQSAATTQWAPAEPARRKRHLGLWIGIPAGLFLAGAVAASLVLIAPGTTVAGVPVGFLTPGAATDAIQNRLAETAVTLGDGGPTLTGADLGAAIDAQAAASTAFGERPLWNVTQWFGDVYETPVTMDADTAVAALRDAAPTLFTDPVGATIAFEGKGYGVTPAVAGEGIDVESIRVALEKAFLAGDTAVIVDPRPAVVEAAATTEIAQGTADSLNAMLKNIGFYVGEERTVPVSARTAADWITVEADETGAFSITADPAKIQTVVDTLKGKVDQKAADATVIVNGAGTVLATTVEGQDGRVLGDVSTVAQDFAAQLAAANGVYELPVEVTAHETTEVARLLEVDVSEQRLYVKENGVVVDSWLISSGRVGADTKFGTYSIGWRTPVQTMRGRALDSGKEYEQPDVRWAMYFNGDQAFHGVYWHSSWGQRMSAGCVGMPEWRAKQIYDWAPTGVDVWIHA